MCVCVCWGVGVGGGGIVVNRYIDVCLLDGLFAFVVLLYYFINVGVMEFYFPSVTYNELVGIKPCKILTKNVDIFYL